jgi:serine phosphatase RsbU (regulator of sigma subunit)
MNDRSPDNSSSNALLEAALRDNALYQDRLYFLTEMGNLLGELEPSLLLVKILELTADFMGADVGSILLVQPDGTLETNVDWGLPHSAVMELRHPDGNSLVEQVVTTGTPQRVRGCDLLPVRDGDFQVGVALVHPLKTERLVLGAIVLILPESGDAERAQRFEVLAPAVGLAAVAVENERLVHMKLANEREQQQLKLAQEIQRGLLPARAPAIAGLELATVYLPATEVGGDYFDFLTLRDGSMALVIADVAGKGVPAGLVMTAVRSIFRTASHVTEEPARLLQQVNVQLCQEHLNGFFVTAACVRVDVEHGLLTTAVAGHEPVLFLRREEVTLGGRTRPQPALGLVERFAYTEETCEFRPGDAFVLYTDGVTEAMNGFRNQFGMRRLQDVAALCIDLDAQAILQEITTAIDEHVGNAPRHDDVTLLVGRRLPA